MIFLSFNSLFTYSLSFTKDKFVINRIVEASKNTLFFKNTKGTCGSNIFFFLKIINLEEHVNNLLSGTVMNKEDAVKNPNINTTLKMGWTGFSIHDEISDMNMEPDSLNRDIRINEQIDIMKNTNEGKKELVKLYINKLQKICSSIGRGFITLFVYPTVSSNHAVAIWYTETGNIIFIDPQRFEKNGKIEIYSDLNDDFERYKSGSGINIYSLNIFLEKSGILYLPAKDSFILNGIHTEINNNTSKLSYDNPYYKTANNLLLKNNDDL